MNLKDLSIPAFNPRKSTLIKPLKDKDKPNKVFNKSINDNKVPYKVKKVYRIAKVSVKRAKQKKDDSEYAMFMAIWAERPHRSELSGKPLKYGPGHKLFVHQFLHVLNKMRFPSLRTDKRNVLLGTPEEHNFQDQFEAFTKRKVELLKELYTKK